MIFTNKNLSLHILGNPERIFSMDTSFYNKTTGHIFTAILLYAIASMLHPFTGVLGGFLKLSTVLTMLNHVVNITILGSVCMFAYYLFVLRNIVDGDDAKRSLTIVFVGAAIAAATTVTNFFHINLITGLVTLAVPIVYVIGYGRLTMAESLPEDARSGAKLCYIASILLIIGTSLNIMLGWILVGGILYALFAIFAYLLLIAGWKKWPVSAT